MKKTLLLICFVFTTGLLSAQCGDLFISEYVEGYGNNKAIEIYNPTGSAIELSDYSLARFSNGNTTAAPPTEQPAYIVQLPQHSLASNDVFVIVLDKQNTDLWNSQFDKPAWNGFNLIDTIFDIVTMEPLTNDDGEVIFGPQYQDGSALFGTEYNERYDLQCKADAFLNPVYDINRTMYFNGNDAVALLKGTEVAVDGSNLIDVIGVIGEDPTETIMEDAWVNEDGFWLTKDRSLIRKPEVAGGRANLNDVVLSLGGTFVGEEWLSYPKNSFDFLGIHNSVCNTNETPDRYSCADGPLATFQINQIPFNMYPNPNASGSLRLEAAENIDHVEIFNLLGQRVLMQNGSASTQTDINIAKLDHGMYLVNLYFADNHISIQKLVVE